MTELKWIILINFGQSLDTDLRQWIVIVNEQFKDAFKPFSEKTKKVALEQSLNCRNTIIDAIYSLNEVHFNLFEIITNLVQENEKKKDICAKQNITKECMDKFWEAIDLAMPRIVTQVSENVCIQKSEEADKNSKPIKPNSLLNEK